MRDALWVIAFHRLHEVLFCSTPTSLIVGALNTTLTYSHGKALPQRTKKEKMNANTVASLRKLQI